MVLNQDSAFIAPNLALTVRWSPRVVDFVAEWESLQARAHSTPPHEHWGHAASAALSGVEQGLWMAHEALAVIHRLTHQLPEHGDLLLLGPLEVRVDQRHFLPRQAGGVSHAEVVYYLGVEKYRFQTEEVPFAS